MRTSAFTAIRYDLNAVMRHDPAAKSKLEAALCYSGFHALVMYRFFHFLYVHRYFLLARFLSALTRFFTGIEIHPGAVIGKGVFIDHGAGVVIGETAVVGDNVVIYQGVTLGGTGKDKGKRHPTVENDVVVCSGAKVLGPFTVGRGAKIGSGSIVLGEVPPHATVVGVPGRIVRIAGKRIDELDQTLPDPVNDEITALTERVDGLERLLANIIKENGDFSLADTEQ
ncbi:MAG: serine O-acetyltransferase [Clostridiales bacterium]|nr:serine O-acetyltransferase [Clostridiales bacterium]